MHADAPPGNAPRHIRFAELLETGGWRIKVYGIATFGKEARPALVDTAVGLARQVFPRPGIAEDRYGTGFVIANGDGPGFVRKLYAAGAWLVLPATAGGCRGTAVIASRKD